MSENPSWRKWIAGGGAEHRAGAILHVPIIPEPSGWFK